jgi:hypothetical protein
MPKPDAIDQNASTPENLTNQFVGVTDLNFHLVMVHARLTKRQMSAGGQQGQVLGGDLPFTGRLVNDCFVLRRRVRFRQ